MLHITKGEKEIVSKRESTSFSTVFLGEIFVNFAVLTFQSQSSVFQNPSKSRLIFFFANAFHCELRETRESSDFVMKKYLNFRAKTIILKIYMCHLSYSKIWKKMKK